MYPHVNTCFCAFGLQPVVCFCLAGGYKKKMKNIRFFVSATGGESFETFYAKTTNFLTKETNTKLQTNVFEVFQIS